MYECVALALHGHSSAKSSFRSQAWAGSVFAVGLRQAQKQCIASWTRDSWTEIFNVFLFGVIPSIAYYFVAYTYYRQTTDPSHPANLLRRSSNRPSSHSEGTQGGYIQVSVERHPYAGTPTSSTNNQGQQRRTRNLPSARLRGARSNAVSAQNAMSTVNQNPTTTTSRFVSRSLKRAHRPPALKELEPPIFATQYAPAVITGSPAGYSVTPGPPTYGIGNAKRAAAGGSYAPVQALLSACSGLSLPSARYDKFV